MTDSLAQLSAVCHKSWISSSLVHPEPESEQVSRVLFRRPSAGDWGRCHCFAICLEGGGSGASGCRTDRVTPPFTFAREYLSYCDSLQSNRVGLVSMLDRCQLFFIPVVCRRVQEDDVDTSYNGSFARRSSAVLVGGQDRACAVATHQGVSWFWPCYGKSKFIKFIAEIHFYHPQLVSSNSRPKSCQGRQNCQKISILKYCHVICIFLGFWGR